MGSLIEFSRTDRRYIVNSYKAKTSIGDLALEYGVATSVIRRVLVEAGVTISGAGKIKGKRYS